MENLKISKGRKSQGSLSVVSQEYLERFEKMTTAESQRIVAENNHYENKKQKKLNRGRTRTVPAVFWRKKNRARTLYSKEYGMSFSGGKGRTKRSLSLDIKVNK